MATDARNERQLMRQRGAGTRIVADTDFDLELGAGTRQERQLMRQRGAGNRQINNIDFGFAFATPSTIKSRRSRTQSKTPASASRRPAHSRITPAPPEQGALQQNISSTRSIRSRRTPLSLRNESGGQPQRKRRRLSEVSNLTRATSVDLPFASISNNIVEEDRESDTELPEEANHGRSHGLQGQEANLPISSPFFSDAHDALNGADKENDHTISPPLKQATRKRKRKSIGQQSLFKKKRNSGTPKQLVLIPHETQKETLSAKVPRNEKQTTRRERRWSIASSEPPPEAPQPTSSPKQATQDPGIAFEAASASPPSKRRKKRKSVVKGKTNRRSYGTVASMRQQIVESIEEENRTEQHEEEDEEEEEEDHELEPSLDLDAEEQSENDDPEDQQPQSKQRHGDASTRSERFRSEDPEQVNLDDDEDADDTFLPEEATPDPTSAPKRTKEKRPQKIARRRTSNNAAAPSPTCMRKRSRKSTFPILIHRMTNIHSLPTIAEAPEEDQQHDSDTDELALPAPPTITTRILPNAVDVLAQVCREAIDSSITNVKAPGLPRADVLRRVTALESFRTTLDTRLFDLSQSLDQRLMMEARLRKTRREKAELQARWLELRRQRDQLDLRKDAVRRKHWEGEVLSRKKFESSQAAFAVENALSSDNAENAAEEATSLELTLREVAADISSANRGGLLHSLQDFNAQLERLAGVLT